jgi:aspartyl-tRNA(Asn)/glutamyl-tRNA(Gln) amidotransferase subunit A
MAVSPNADPAQLTIVAARREIRARRLSAVELTEAVLARAERLNPSLNAYLHLDAEGALAQARAADRRGDQPPLLGVPVCVKDVIDVADLPTTAGAAYWRRSPARDAPAVARLRAAGAIVIGKGHTNEFAYGIDGRNPHWGNCHNPHDPARICGGSSSGPAVATAAGMALAGLGTDTTGSLRVPASFCGLVGIRPTLGQVPIDGVVPLAWTYDTVGPLARCVPDAALLLQVLTDGVPPGRAGVAPNPGAGPAPRHDHPLQGLRLGLLEQLLEASEPYVESGVIEAAMHLEGLGADIQPIRLELLPRAGAIHHIVQHAEAARIHMPWFETQAPYYSDAVRTRLEAGRLLPATAYLAAQQSRRLLIEEVARKMHGLDALLAPSAPVVAPPQDAETVTIRGITQDLRAGLLSCVLAPSELACPVISTPIGRHQGLPFGMQIIGRPFSEPLLLRVALASEPRWEAIAPRERARVG